MAQVGVNPVGKRSFVLIIMGSSSRLLPPVIAGPITGVEEGPGNPILPGALPITSRVHHSPTHFDPVAVPTPNPFPRQSRGRNSFRHDVPPENDESRRPRLPYESRSPRATHPNDPRTDRRDHQSPLSRSMR